jgi:hypothetical protein
MDRILANSRFQQHDRVAVGIANQQGFFSGKTLRLNLYE